MMKIADKTFLHPNLTMRKVIYYGIASGAGALIVAGGTYALTEWGGLWYVTSTIISGVVAFLVKFAINATWTFK